MREALSHVMVPGLSPGQLPPLPDVENFKPPPVLAGNNCNGNDKAISLEINDASGLVIQICTFLDFELEGELSADGLLEELDEYVSLELDLDAKYNLKGALSTGVKITIPSLTESPVIELDPVIAQLHLQGNILGSASFGLLRATVSGDASLRGEFKLGYCPSCNGIYPGDDYNRLSNTSSFYFGRQLGYDLGGELELSAGMHGVNLGVGTEIGIKDENIFDDEPAYVQLPTAQSLLDAMKFSPQNAVSKSPMSCGVQFRWHHSLTLTIFLDMLQIVDLMLAQTTSNKAFDVRIPFLETSIKKVTRMASVFTSALFEFFVTVEPFHDRAKKSLLIKGYVLLFFSCDVSSQLIAYESYFARGDVAKITVNSNFELYVLREDLTVNPIPERADALRAQAATEGGLCSIQIPSYTEIDTTDSYLTSVVSSVTSSAQCNIDVCRSGGCNACSDEAGTTTCRPCNSTGDCDGLGNIIEYRYCDCDVVVTVDDLNQFSLYTGKV
jgi:hypothetical protein